MVTLRGVLATAFDNSSVLCLRGFAKLSDLAESSVVDSEYQRPLDTPHGDRLVQYLKEGQYTFFPEIILGLSMERVSGKSYQSDYSMLKGVVEESTGFQIKKFGEEVSMSAYVKRRGDGQILGEDYATLSIYNLPTDRDKKKLVRIDGNHRLSAFETLKGTAEWDEKYNVAAPFCLVIFSSDAMCKEYGSIYFHNINFHQLRVSEEHILKLIIDNQELFSDEKLKTDPSFGESYALTREYLLKYESTGRRICLAYPQMEQVWYSFVQHCFDMLLKKETQIREILEPVEDGELQANTISRAILKSPYQTSHAIDSFDSHVQEVVRCLNTHNDFGLFSELNYELLMALVFFSYKGKSVLNRFISWVVANNFIKIYKTGDFVGRHPPHDFLIDAFEMYYERYKHTIFLSMEFGKDVTENHSKVIHRIVDEINRECNVKIPLRLCRIDCMDEGRSYEINSKIFREISMSGLLIADLTNMNPNVYHEIGIAMGGAIAEGKEPGDNILLILDTSVPEDQKKVKFNLQTYRQIRFTQSEDLGVKLKQEIMIHFGLEFSRPKGIDR